MKRLFPMWVLPALLLAVGCSKYDDSGLTDRINDLEQRMKELETLCKETNTNISSLQTVVSAVQSGDYVKEVTPVMQDGKEIGYTITFGKGNPITIYHNSGSNTGEGTMPVIGVRQDEDGAYYWILNDEWLLDDAGQKITAQSTPPKLKLENGYWYVSYDGEQTWLQFGKATSDDSDLMFQEVKQDDHNIYFTLASGEKITVPKMSGLAISFQEGNSFLFNLNETKTIHYTIAGGGTEHVVKAELLNDDGGYTLRTVSSSATAGTIEIRTEIPTKNRVIVSVSDGSHTIMTAIDVSFLTIEVEKPGTLGQLLAGYDRSEITILAVIGSINEEDVAALAALPNLSVLDIENTDLTVLRAPNASFIQKETLTSIQLPKTLTTIGDNVFLDCSNLMSVTIPENVTTIGHSTFARCTSLTSVSIPSSVTTIGHSAFSGCSSLTSVTIPEGITLIKASAFEGCSGLTNITIPDGVTGIEGTAFWNCSGLTSVTISSSVTGMGPKAFADCSSLTRIDCKSQTPPELGNLALYSSTEKCVLYVPTGCAEAYRTAEEWKDLTFKDIIETEF